jgi:transcriptional regulator of acetoin/glycerol metabolism
MEDDSMLPNGNPVALRKAWSRYAEDDQLDIHLIRPEVARSWQRCRNSKLDAFLKPNDYVSEAELGERLFRKEHLIRVGLPFMEDLYAFVKHSEFLVVLTDEHGTLLRVLGDKTPIPRSSGIDLRPGEDWGETARGTNAVGTALFERKPVQIYAWEHYCQNHHYLTCSACPILDPNGAIIGVLDISGDYRLANPHTLGMVVAAAHAIRNQFQLEAINDKLHRAYQYSSLLMESMSDSQLSINTNGIVTEINSKAGRLLGVDPIFARGRHISQVCSIGGAIIPVLESGEEHQVKEVVIGKTGKKVTCSASMLRSCEGNVIGALAVFSESAPASTRLLPRVPSRRASFDDIVGEGPVMKHLKEWAKVVAAASPSTVLITGETGTGKELFAQAIHNVSARKNGAFIALNCAALPENLVESELFGYEEGAFTGGKKGGRAGKFELADGGTIFLDEIGDVPLTTQMKLLRLIQEKTYVRLGSAEEREVNVRIVAATHKDLSVEVQRGTFREDLYYRLTDLEVKIPPLRQRREDIAPLTQHIIQKIVSRLADEGHERFAALTRMPSIHIQDSFVKKLESHVWPGNIRELENVIERALVRMGANDELHADLIEFSRQQLVKAEIIPDHVKPLRDAEKDSISEALIVFKNNIKQTSVHLGITRNTLYRKMKEYGISPNTSQV